MEKPEGTRMDTDKHRFYSQLTFYGFYWDADEHGSTRMKRKEINYNIYGFRLGLLGVRLGAGAWAFEF